VSSFGNDFNRDYNVSFTKDEIAQHQTYYNYQTQDFPREEAPGASVFYKNAAGDLFHTYSTYGRGLDILVGAYNYLDLVPKGRDEEGLDFTMSWVRHHDRYPEEKAATRRCHGGNRANGRMGRPIRRCRHESWGGWRDGQFPRSYWLCCQSVLHV
jgi:hypothetical protein